MPGKKDERFTEIRNRKAGREYFVGETFEAGIALTGTEIKSLRAGRAQINDAFVRVDGGEAVMYQSHISEYDFGNINNHNPARRGSCFCTRGKSSNSNRRRIPEGSR